MATNTLGYVSAGANFGLQSILVRPKRSIGEFTAQVTLSEQHSDDLEITQHPVELGAEITDHSFKKPADLVIVAGWSNSPASSSTLAALLAIPGATISGIQSLLSGSTKSQVNDIYAKLLALQNKREPFDVYTGKRIYKNMLIKSLSTTTSKETENALIVTVTLRQVLLVSTRTVTVPTDPANLSSPPSTQAPVNRGQQSLQPGTSYTPPAATGG